jgi:hypothetical protein
MNAEPKENPWSKIPLVNAAKLNEFGQPKPRGFNA